MTNYFSLDSLNILFLVVMAIVVLSVIIYQGKQSFKHNVILTAFIISMAGAILSNNLGLMWVFVEATTLTSAYLIIHDKNKNSLEAAWKYTFLCSIGISLAFVGIILMLLASGNLNSLNIQVLYNNAALINPFWLKLAFVFVLCGFGTKVGLAPVHSWLPDAHAEAPSPISAMLSAALLNSAFLVILRVFKLMELAGIAQTAKTLLIIMGMLSIFVAAVFIFKIGNYKRMLAYSSIENMGIIALGVGLGGVATFAAMLHLIAHSLIKCSLFLTSGNILKLYKTKEIPMVKSIMGKDKVTSWLWITGAIFIIAIPPSPIFVSEFLMIKEMIVSQQYILAIAFVLLLTVIAFGIMSPVVKMSFDREVEFEPQKLLFRRYFPQILLLLPATLLCFCLNGGLYDFISEAVRCIY